MASFFGEIIEPNSRALFDDFSDEEEDSKELELQLKWVDGENKISVYDVIFIVHGRLSLALAESCLLEQQSSASAEINVIKHEVDSEKDDDWPKIKELPSKIYIKNNFCICLVSPSLYPELAHQFCDIIAPILKSSKKVIVLTNDSLYNYKTQNMYELPPAFIKELRSSHCEKQNIADPLEIPNFITGIPAAVMSWCEIHQKNASGFICYTDQQKLDSITASPYFTVIKKICPKIITNENLLTNRKTFYGNPGIIGGSSNIYI